jgi:hypothetical protein
MKSMKFLLLLTSFIVLGISSCDVIEEPFEENGGPPIVDESSPNILLEEFTGHTCVHCPTGNEVAKKLEEQYEGKLIVVSIHGGWFARPEGKYTYDYRTKEGTELNSFYDADNNMPCALVNRQANKVINYSYWSNTIRDFWKKNKTRQLDIALSADYNVSEKTITANVKLNYLVPQSKENKVCLWIVEDSIISWQKQKKEPIEVPDYRHDDVFRGSMNGTWGDVVSKSTIPINFEFNRNYIYDVPTEKDWKPNYLRLIAFVYDEQGIKQVVVTKINVI